MAVTNLARQPSVVAFAPTSSVTAAPTSTTDGFQAVGYSTVRALIAYTATVNSATVRIWFRDRGTNIWYAGLDTGTLGALAPGGATVVNESRDWFVGQGSEVYFQLTAVAGGGTVGVRIQGVLA